jgi:acetolactate synthase I/III small subunit
MTDIFRGSIVDVGPRSIVIQLTGPEDKIEAFVELCRPYGIKALSRTGVIAVPRSSQTEEPVPADTGRRKRVRTVTSTTPSSTLILPPS